MKTGGRPLLVGARVCLVIDNDIHGTVVEDLETTLPEHEVAVLWDLMPIAKDELIEDLKEIENDGN